MARPNLSYLKNLILTLAGVPMGLWTGLTGTGPSIFAAPSVRWLVGLKDARLACVVLSITIVSGLFSFIAYHQGGYLSAGLAFLFSAFAVIGAYVGSQTVFQPVRDTKLFGIIWSCLALIAGTLMIYCNQWIAGIATAASSDISWGWPVVRFVTSGFLTGFLGRIMGLGGVLTVPILELVCGMSPLSAQGIALETMFFVSILPTAAHVTRGEIPFQPLLWLSLGAGFGALVGSRLAIEMREASLVFLYGIGLFVAGIIKLLSALSPPPKEPTTTEMVVKG